MALACWAELRPYGWHYQEMLTALELPGLLKKQSWVGTGRPALTAIFPGAKSFPLPSHFPPFYDRGRGA